MSRNEEVFQQGTIPVESVASLECGTITWRVYFLLSWKKIIYHVLCCSCPQILNLILYSEDQMFFHESLFTPFRGFWVFQYRSPRILLYILLLQHVACLQPGHGGPFFWPVNATFWHLLVKAAEEYMAWRMLNCPYCDYNNTEVKIVVSFPTLFWSK